MRLLHSVLGASRTKVLLTVIHLHAAKGRVTLREVSAGAGLSLSNTVRHLHYLRDEGFVAWDDGKHGTLRPLVSEVPCWLRESA